MAATQLTRTHRILIGVVVAGAVVIAGIGFAGSYAAVRELALHKGFGNFSYVFPIGVDAGICVLLALDLLLTWMRIPFPLLRQTAWLLTAATIAFNGAAAWPDPLGVGMHAVIPVLFVVSVEAARHAVGRIADITADKHMEGVRLTRWLLSPDPHLPAVAPDEAVGAAQLRAGHQARTGPPGLPGPPPGPSTAAPGAARPPSNPSCRCGSRSTASRSPRPPRPGSPRPASSRSCCRPPPRRSPSRTGSPSWPRPRRARPAEEQPPVAASGLRAPGRRWPVSRAAHHAREPLVRRPADLAGGVRGHVRPGLRRTRAPPQPQQEPVMVPAGPGRERRLGVPDPRAARAAPRRSSTAALVRTGSRPEPTHGRRRVRGDGVRGLPPVLQRSDSASIRPSTCSTYSLSDGHGVSHPDSTAVLRKLHPSSSSASRPN